MTDPLKWDGVPVEMLAEIEQIFCRCRNRRSRFGGDDQSVIGRGHVAMLGLLVAGVYEYVANHVGRLNRNNFGSAVGMSSNETTKMFNGMLQNEDRRRTTAMEFLELLLLGNTDKYLDPDGRRGAIFDRVKGYFERGSNEGKASSYFSEPRQSCGDPCSPTELAGEIAFLARERLLRNREMRLILVSGESEFPFDWSSPERPIKKALSEALANGVRTQFVFSTDQTPAGISIQDFYDNRGKSHCELIERHALQDAESSHPSWWEFLNPVMQFVYLDTGQGPRHEETLFIVRALRHDSEPHNGHVALALEANQTELDRFRMWINDVL